MSVKYTRTPRFDYLIESCILDKNGVFHTSEDIALESRTVNIDHQFQRTLDMRYIIKTTKTDAGTKVLPITEDVAQMFQKIIEDRNASKVEKSKDGYSGFLFYDDNGMPLIVMHWQHQFNYNHMVGRYNDIYRVQMPNITPHVLIEYGKIGNAFQDVKVPHGTFGYIRCRQRLKRRMMQKRYHRKCLKWCS